MAVNEVGLKLDTDGDLLVSSFGELTLLSGADLVKQRIEVALRSIKGDWFADSAWGVDYRNILVRNLNRAYAEADFKLAILGVPGVQSLVSFSMEKDDATEHLTVSFEALTADGVVVEGSI